jgi:hypothetical protein
MLSPLSVYVGGEAGWMATPRREPAKTGFREVGVIFSVTKWQA